MKKAQYERRCGLERREFYYTEYTPERRSFDDRRVGKNGGKVFWIQATKRVLDYIKTRLKNVQFKTSSEMLKSKETIERGRIGKQK
jgi:hypothetical protein